MAVPAPSSPAAKAHDPKVLLSATSARPTACTHMPVAISHLRPHRSDRAPVASWPTPHTAGYSAASTPMRPTDSPAAANSTGNSPQARPSLRLFTNPAWLAEDRAG